MTAHGSDFCVALFLSVNHVLRAEGILKGEGVSVKLIPVPKYISTECGVCLRFAPAIGMYNQGLRYPDG